MAASDSASNNADYNLSSYITTTTQSETTRAGSTNSSDLRDPFVTPTASSTASDAFYLQQQPAPPVPIYAPQPCMNTPSRPQKAYSPRHSREAVPSPTEPASKHDRMHSGTTYAESTPTNIKSGSWSSCGSTAEGVCSVDLEKGNFAKEYEQWRSSRASRTSKQSRHSRDTSRKGGDPEKQSHHHHHRSSRRSSNARTPDNASDAISEEDEDDAESQPTPAYTALQYQKAVRILFFLSGPVVTLSFVNLIWTIISLIITVLSQPVRLCAKRLSFGTQLAGLLGPALNLQLKAIHTPLPPHVNEDGSYHTGWLILVQLLSPFVSIGVALTSWIVAMYWVLAAIVGEPDPAVTEKRDDGRETCLGLRKWWEKWLARALVGL